MKKTLVILSAAILMLTLFACRNPADQNRDAETAAVETTVTETTVAETAAEEAASESQTDDAPAEQDAADQGIFDAQADSEETPEENAEDAYENASVDTASKDTDAAQETTASEEGTTLATQENPPIVDFLLGFLAQYDKIMIPILGGVLLLLIVSIILLLRKGKKEKKRAAQSPHPIPAHPGLAVEPQAAIPAGEAQPMYMTLVTFEPDNQAPLKVVRVHNIGKRKNQEDSFGVSNLKDQTLCAQKGVLAVVADGMGGLKGGEDVSSIAVLSMLQAFSDTNTGKSDTQELTDLLNQAVQKVNAQLVRTVGLKKGGSTLMAVIIHGRELSWVSVGDSRTALFRGGKLTDLNRKHIYAAELEEMVRQNRITPQQAANHPDRNKLTSYLGMGELKYIDRSVRPMQLCGGDKIILMSDGIFNTLTDPDIEQILSLPIEQIGDRLETAVLQKNNPYQDNFTAVVLEIPNN